MRGQSQKMTRRQEVAIAALLNCPTIAEAAKIAGVGEATLWRWLQNKDFQARYQEAKREAVRQAISHLQKISSEAVEVLREIMLNPGNPASSRVAAAKTVLETAIKAVELEDLTVRVDELERLVKTGGNAR